MVTAAMKRLFPWEKSYDQPRQHIKKQRHHFVNKGPTSEGYDFSSSHVWMWDLDYKESWVLKNWYLWTVALEKTIESPLDCKEIQPVHPKGDQSWVFTGRTDVEAETPILWPPDVKSWLIGKYSDAGRDWGQEEKGTTEDEMAGWHHGLSVHGFGWTPEVDDGQGGLGCCCSWGRKELDTTERLDWSEYTSRHKYYHGLWLYRICVWCLYTHVHTTQNAVCCWSESCTPWAAHYTLERSCPVPVHHHLPEFTQTEVHRVSAIQPFHPLSSPSPPAPNPSQHQSL